MEREQAPLLQARQRQYIQWRSNPVWLFSEIDEQSHALKVGATIVDVQVHQASSIP